MNKGLIGKKLAATLAKPPRKLATKGKKAQKSQLHGCDSKHGCGGNGPVGKGESMGPVLNSPPDPDFES